MKTIKVILIEDNPGDARLITEYLKSSEKMVYQLFSASNLEEGVDLISNNEIDIIISDLNLPDSKGLDTCRSILKESANVPVVLLTGMQNQSLAHEAVMLGAQDYIVKNGLNEYVLFKTIDFAIERKKLQDKILRSEQNLNQTKDKFFNIIAHDLRNPLNGLMGLSDIISAEFDNYDDTEKKRLLEKMKEAIHSTYKLIENLLEWSRVQTGKISASPVSIDLHSLSKEIVSITQPSADMKSISIENNISDTIKVFADEDQLRFIIRNIITNAIKFTGANGEITLNAEKIESLSGKRNFVNICISDNGVGISQENLEKIFMLDQKFSQKGTNEEQGTGLGLLLCKEFTELNEGTIIIKSDKGEGTEVCFKLPEEKDL